VGNKFIDQLERMKHLPRDLFLEGKCSHRPWPESDLLCGFPGTAFFRKPSGEYFCRCATHASGIDYKEVTKEEFEVAQVMES